MSVAEIVTFWYIGDIAADLTSLLKRNFEQTLVIALAVTSYGIQQLRDCGIIHRQVARKSRWEQLVQASTAFLLSHRHTTPERAGRYDDLSRGGRGLNLRNFCKKLRFAGRNDRSSIRMPVSEAGGLALTILSCLQQWCCCSSGAYPLLPPYS